MNLQNRGTRPDCIVVARVNHRCSLLWNEWDTHTQKTHSENTHRRIPTQGYRSTLWLIHEAHSSAELWTQLGTCFARCSLVKSQSSCHSAPSDVWSFHINMLHAIFLLRVVNTEPRDRCAHEQEEHRLIDHFIEMYQIVKQRVIIQPEGVEGGRRVVVDRGRSRVQRLNHPRNGKFMTY